MVCLSVLNKEIKRQWAVEIWFILLLRFDYNYLSMILDLVLDALKTYVAILMGAIYLYSY